MKYSFTYYIEPFIDKFKLTVEADNENEALKKWRKSILSYHATLISINEVTE